MLRMKSKDLDQSQDFAESFPEFILASFPNLVSFSKIKSYSNVYSQSFWAPCYWPDTSILISKLIFPLDVFSKGYIVVGYRGTFAFGRDMSDVKVGICEAQNLNFQICSTFIFFSV